MSEENKETLNREKVVSSETSTTGSVDALLDKTEKVIKSGPEDRPYEEVIEEARLGIREEYRKARLMSNISMGVSVVLLVVAFLLFSKTGSLQIIGYIIAALTLVGMIVFYVLTRNKMPAKIKAYIKVVTTELNKAAFSASEYSDLTTDPSDRFASTDFVTDGVYSQISNIASRNIVRGTFAKKTFAVGDIALRGGQGKNITNRFVGKYISISNDAHFEGRYVIVSKRSDGEVVDLPNAIEDLVVLEEKENFIVYGPEGRKYNEELGTKIIPALKKIEVGKDLYGMTVVLWAGHSAAYLSYSDTIVALPFENQFNKEAYDKYASTQLVLLKALKTLIK